MDESTLDSAKFCSWILDFFWSCLYFNSTVFWLWSLFQIVWTHVKFGDMIFQLIFVGHGLCLKPFRLFWLCLKLNVNFLNVGHMKNRLCHLSTLKICELWILWAFGLWTLFQAGCTLNFFWELLNFELFKKLVGLLTSTSGMSSMN